MDSSGVWNLLQTLVGTWEGKGAGRYPTIDDFRYREVLEISSGYDGLLLHYKQTTWKMTDDGEAGSHVETGFIGVADDGTVEITSSQALDRVEVLTGGVTVSDDGMFLEVGDGVRLEQPGELVYLASATGGQLAQPRNLIRIGANSHANIIERYVSGDDVDHLDDQPRHDRIGHGHAEYVPAFEFGEKVVQIGSQLGTRCADRLTDTRKRRQRFSAVTCRPK